MRYIIIEKDMGVFLGSYAVFAVFAKNEKFGLTKAVSFNTREEAQTFIETLLNKEDSEFDIVSINSKDRLVRVEDIIRAGYGQYTHGMLNNVPMQSDSIH